MQTLRTRAPEPRRPGAALHGRAGSEPRYASAATPARASAAPDAALPGAFQHLSLVDETEMDEDTVLRDIAVRQESRASLPLHLLGQRFGVLAGAPAFDAERLPLGPQSLCRILRDASAVAADLRWKRGCCCTGCSTAGSWSAMRSCSRCSTCCWSPPRASCRA